MMDILIKWRNTSGEQPVWETFPIADITGHSRDHAKALFTRGIDVVIRQGETMISNNMDMRNLYRKRGNKVMDLAAVQASDEPLHCAGFL